MGINKTELMALRWLKNQGYKKGEIIKGTRSPGFVCSDGKRYEVKFLYGDKILFTEKQVESLKDNDIILIFNKKKFIDKFLWKDRSKIHLEIHIPKKPVSLSLTDEAEQMLRDRAKKNSRSMTKEVEWLLYHADSPPV